MDPLNFFLAMIKLGFTVMYPWAETVLLESAG